MFLELPSWRRATPSSGRSWRSCERKRRSRRKRIAPPSPACSTGGAFATQSKTSSRGGAHQIFDFFFWLSAHSHHSDRAVLDYCRVVVKGEFNTGRKNEIEVSLLSDVPLGVSQESVERGIYLSDFSDTCKGSKPAGEVLSKRLENQCRFTCGAPSDHR